MLRWRCSVRLPESAMTSPVPHHPDACCRVGGVIWEDIYGQTCLLHTSHLRAEGERFDPRTAAQDPSHRFNVEVVHIEAELFNELPYSFSARVVSSGIVQRLAESCNPHGSALSGRLHGQRSPEDRIRDLVQLSRDQTKRLAQL